MGSRQIALIDPGPDVESHVRALASRVSGAARVSIVLTHGHADHAGATSALVGAIEAEGCAPPEVFGPVEVEGVTRPVEDGGLVTTDEGALRAIHTPGHTREHLCFQWPERNALFAGDLLLGEGDTTWVAEYPGCVADYLHSLERIRSLGLSVIYPAHGPPLRDPGAALDRFEGHRRERVRQVEDALRRAPADDIDTLLDIVYGPTLPDAMRPAAGRSLAALVDFVKTSAN